RSEPESYSEAPVRRVGRRSSWSRFRLDSLFGGRCQRAACNHPDDAPGLGLRDRPSLHDLDGVPRVREVVLVMGMTDGAPLQVLAVVFVPHAPLLLDATRFGHLVAGHHADGALLDAARLGLRLVHGSALLSGFDGTLALNRLEPGNFPLGLF